MFIRKRERKLILTYLFTEGVMTAEKNYNSEFVIQAADEINPLITVPNLQVIKLMQSLTSKGFVRTTFNWNHFYYFLTEEGVEHLREYLHLPADVKPLTEMKSAAPQPIAGAPGGHRGDRGDRGDRGGFGRRREGGDRRYGNNDGGYRRREQEQ